MNKTKQQLIDELWDRFEVEVLSSVSYTIKDLVKMVRFWEE